jgi:hypothetical protein
MNKIAFIAEIDGVQVLTRKAQDNDHYFIYTEFQIEGEDYIRSIRGQFPKTNGGLKVRDERFENITKGALKDYHAKIIASSKRQVLNG